MIDLHSHTTASDGQYSPTQLVALAVKAGVTQLAVTDHDTLQGLAEAQTAALESNLSIICGIEMSAAIGDKEIHILGHFVDPLSLSLLALAKRLSDQRIERMERMILKARGLGIPVTLEEVVSLAKGNLGRPHLALLLVQKRICANSQEAFKRFLGDGKMLAVSRLNLPAEEAIETIRLAHGTATVAHPGVSKVEKHHLQALVEAGLSGIEVFHSDHSSPLKEKYLAFAKTFNLIPTAGSDFHGEQVAPNRKLGNVSMDPLSLAELKSRRAAPASL